MLVLRIAFTAVVMFVAVALAAAGNPVALVIVPAAAVWVRRAAESGRLARSGR